MSEQEGPTEVMEAIGEMATQVTNETRCAACLQYHITDADRDDARPVGESLVHRDCAWQIDYPHHSLGELIAALEQVIRDKVLDGGNVPDYINEEF